MSGAELVLVGQLFGTALACGLNLYATVAVLGLGARLGWTAPLPDGLLGLQHPVVIGSAILLFAIEFVIDKLPHADSLWDAVHTFIRPTAAGLLAFGALEPLSPELRVAGSLVAGAAALAAHGVKAGVRVSLNAQAARTPAPVLSLAEDVAAVALVLVVLRSPDIALAVAGGAVALVALGGPRFWRAFLLGLRALSARLYGFFRGASWHDVDALPPDFRALLEPTPIGLAPPRAARAAMTGHTSVAAYRNGWLVVGDGDPVFLYRSFITPKRVVLPPPRPAGARSGLWVDVLELDGRGSRCTLLLLKDGPSAANALAALEPVPA